MATHDKSSGDIPQETIVKFQALWRGYIYKQAFPFALAQVKERKQRFIEWKNEQQEQLEYMLEPAYDY